MKPHPAMLMLQDAREALVPPIAVLALHLLRHKYWPDEPNMDIVAHFLGGYAIAWMGVILWARWTQRGWLPTSIPGWLRLWAIWGTVALVGIFWEFHEWLADHFFHTVMQPSITDTMNDFLMDLGGGALFLALNHMKNRSKEAKKKKLA
jgi:hypothetical protein